MTTPIASIIIPVYNAEKYIIRCLESVLHQTYENFEVLLIDDGSTDNSGKICDIYSQKDSRIYTYHQSNMGQSSARNKALMKAQGKYIVFIDADDYIADTLLEKTIPKMEKDDIDILIFQHNEITVNGVVPFANEFEKRNVNINMLSIKEIRKLVLMDEISNLMWNKIYKRSVWENLRFPAGYYYEDLYICPELFLHAENVEYISNVLYYNNRINPQSTTSSGNDENSFNRYSKFRAYRQHEKVAKRLKVADAEKWAKEKSIHEAIKIVYKNFYSTRKITKEELDDVISYLGKNKKYNFDLGLKDRILWWSALNCINACKVYGYIGHKLKTTR